MKEYLYLEVAAELEKEIDDRVYSVHQKLPSETDLAKHFNISRLTLRKAIEALEKRHVVVKDRNRGTYALATTQKISSGADGLAGFTEVAKRMHLHPETQVLSLKAVDQVPVVVQEGLHLHQSEPLWQIERLRFVNNEPMTHEQIYVRQATLPDLTSEQASQSLYDLIEQQTAIGYASQELESVNLDSKTSQFLAVKAGDSAFLAHTVAFSVDGYPILYDNSYYRADKYTFHNILYRHH